MANAIWQKINTQKLTKGIYETLGMGGRRTIRRVVARDDGANGHFAGLCSEDRAGGELRTRWPVGDIVLWLAVMFVSQFALLAVPVRVASLRPVTQGPLWQTVPGRRL